MSQMERWLKMENNSGNSKRCVIYAFYDKDGFVDEFVYHMLDAMRQTAERVIFVANGNLLADARKNLIANGMEVITRNNKGLDIWAYKMGMLYVGWEELEKYDEVVLLNNSILGPVYPFSEVFGAMDAKDVDFWGLTRHPELHLEQFKGTNDYGYVPEHVQSFFVAFRKSMLQSYEFRYYWDNLPSIETYNDAVYKHEVIFTKYFADMGFAWDVYLHTEEIDYLTSNPMIYYPKLMVEKYRCPVFKRRIFLMDYNEVLQNTCGQSAMELYNYINDHHLYDTNIIWNNLLRTCNMNDLFKNLHLDYILSGNMSHAEQMREILKTKKAAVIIHIYFIDLLDDTYRYVSQIPDVCDIYITTNSQKTKAAIEEKFSDIQCNHLEIRMIQNRGRDVASILVGVKDIVSQYEYLCFTHDKKSTQVLGSVGESFSYKCFENTLYSEDYIYNIIETFENNPRLGVLCPPEPNHADYSVVIGMSWGQNDNLKITQKLAEEMNIHVPMDRDKDAIAPFGSFFWFRYDALKAFYERGWDYEDFPEEPLPPDGTISHAIERLRPFVAQQAGYYTAYVMVDNYARIEYTNLRTCLEDFNKACFDNGYLDLHHSMIKYLGSLISSIWGKEI